MSDKLVSYLRTACDRSLKKEDRAAVLVRVGLLVEWCEQRVIPIHKNYFSNPRSGSHADLVKEQALTPLIVCNVMEAITINAFSMRQADSIPTFYDRAPVTVITLLANNSCCFLIYLHNRKPLMSSWFWQRPCRLLT